MDKNWIHQPRTCKSYLDGVDRFLNFAFDKSAHEGKILCPCVKCVNILWQTREDVKDHLICEGFLTGYTNWVLHGEPIVTSSYANETNLHENPDAHDNMDELFHEAFGILESDIDRDVPRDDPSQFIERPNLEAKFFYNLLSDAHQELYLGCKKFNKLSYVVRLFHLKCLNGWSNKSFTQLLEFLKETYPEGENLPKSFYETKKIISELGLKYEKIDACPNDCMLYWKDKAKDSACSTCGVSRWKNQNTSLESNTTSTSQTKDSKVPAKVLRYFPLKPRLQRLFMSSKTASHMTWHEKERNDDGVLRHPADSPAWKHFNALHPDFASDARNVRLGLASDGFNPFRTMNINHSAWPVLLMPYNLPPWMCMKQPYIMLSLLIPGPSAPGNSIDVYLQPLVEELQELWEVGSETFDASSNQNFQMRAALMWTINDFPAYANLSGWSTKGKLACPSCNKNTWSRRLKKSGKECFMGHRRFLDPNHKFRFDAGSFDGKEDFRPAPTPPSGSTVLNQLEGLDVKFGKTSNSQSSKKRKRKGEEDPFLNWKKKSIFFKLPYWEHNLLRHNIDVMHVEKNICDSVLGTLLNIDGKTKDGLKARLDLIDMNIRETLQPEQKGSNKTYLPPACYSMSARENDIFRSVLRDVKVSDGYSSNISRSVQGNSHKVLSLKSHDCHIIMQQLLPLAVRRVLPKNVSLVLIELSEFFTILCSKVNTVEVLEELEHRTALTLCNLERIFLPAFFDVMVHVAVHLATEAKIAGPVYYRWMYPIERYLSTLKSYVGNRAHPEGSIAEGYLADECLTFCSRYLDGVETKFNRPVRNYTEGDIELQQFSPIFTRSGRHIGKAVMVAIDDIELVQAHRYVLFNCTSVNPFLQEHLSTIKRQHRRTRIREREIERIHNETFHSWFQSHVEQLELQGNEQISEEIKWLAKGPSKLVRRFGGFIINGTRFHTKDREKKRKTQNSGVVVTAKTLSFASSRDRNPVTGDVTYYGALKDIIELNYYDKFKVVLFKCDWVNVAQDSGIKKDEYGFTLVNFSRLMSSGVQLSDEPFVLASQARQVFYVKDPLESDWHVVIKTKPRDLYDMGEEIVGDTLEAHPMTEATNEEVLPDTLYTGNENDDWVRKGVDGITIDAPLVVTQVEANNLMDDTGSNSDDESEEDIMIDA